MIFYKATIDLNEKIEDPKIDEKAGRNLYHRTYSDVYNEKLVELYLADEIPIFFQLGESEEDEVLWFVGFAAYEQKSLAGGKLDVIEDVRFCLKAIEFAGNIESITVEELSAMGFSRGDKKYGFGHVSESRQIMEDRLYLDFGRFGVDGFDFSERIVDAHGFKDVDTALNNMQKLLPGDALADEVARIYDSSHPRDFYYGIPVHYKLSTNSDVVADDMVDFLVGCLYKNKRLLSRRITKISDIEMRIRDVDSLFKLIKCAQGSAVQIMLTGDVASESEYASQYHRVTEVLAEYINANAASTLFFFVEDSTHPGFAKQLLAKVDEEMDILEIKEGAGDADKARDYFTGLLKDSNMQRFYKETDVPFEPGKFYSASDVRGAYNKWMKDTLKDRVYPAYYNSGKLRIGKEVSDKGSAYEQLEAMIGLKDIKAIVGDIIAAYKVQKLRNKYYDPNVASSKHLIFTGNPGTAKTTVARLMTEIMKENDILSTGAFVEVGRADLVGQYVGWTAVQVRRKFQEAKGGVLFIDEAYSLSDASRSFGDEAINTIVQEMENRRGEVIVIFAGYPDKMEEFLNKNEGLRSRIAFHVDFPDYTPEELGDIFKKVLKENRYTIDDDGFDKALDIFRKVHKEEGYGNGRFVRNMFEQAVNRQAARISALTDREVTKEELFELAAADLDTNISKLYTGKKGRVMGFN